MSENVKRWYVYNGELLSGDEYDPAEDDENLYVPVVFGPGYDALLAERDALRGRLDDANAAAARALAAADVERDRFDALREAGEGLREIARSERCRCWKTSGPCRRCAALAAWRAATGEDA